MKDGKTKANNKMAAQLCRVQHRAGGLFIIICRNSEEAKALHVLGLESYVQAWQLSRGMEIWTNVKGFQKDTITMAAECASKEAWTGNKNVVDQLLRKALSMTEKVEWTISNEIGETNLECLQRKRERAVDEEKGVRRNAVFLEERSWTATSHFGRSEAVGHGAR